jgi:hypothetical protein
MAEVSPPKADEKEGDGGRVVALGGLRRVFNSRRKARGQTQTSRSRDGRDEADSGSENDVEDDVVFSPPINTSNHYTLNMSNAPAAHSDMPYILLGCVNSSCGAKCNWRSLVSQISSILLQSVPDPTISIPGPPIYSYSATRR